MNKTSIRIEYIALYLGNSNNIFHPTLRVIVPRIYKEPTILQVEQGGYNFTNIIMYKTYPISSKEIEAETIEDQTDPGPVWCSNGRLQGDASSIHRASR